MLIIFARKPKEGDHSNFLFVSLVSLLFGFTAYGVIHYCATSDYLPQTMFPDLMEYLEKNEPNSSSDEDEEIVTSSDDDNGIYHKYV